MRSVERRLRTGQINGAYGCNSFRQVFPFFSKNRLEVGDEKRATSRALARPLLLRTLAASKNASFRKNRSKNEFAAPRGEKAAYRHLNLPALVG